MTSSTFLFMVALVTTIFLGTVVVNREVDRRGKRVPMCRTHWARKGEAGPCPRS